MCKKSQYLHKINILKCTCKKNIFVCILLKWALLLNYVYKIIKSSIITLFNR